MTEVTDPRASAIERDSRKGGRRGCVWRSNDSCMQKKASCRKRNTTRLGRCPGGQRMHFCSGYTPRMI